MSLVRKGSRIISVDGVSYRWRVRHKPTYGQEIFATEMTFAVEALTEGEHRCVLLVRLNVARPDAVLEASEVAVTPVMVAMAIRRGLQQGWLPLSHGAAHVLSLQLPLDAA